MSSKKKTSLFTTNFYKDYFMKTFMKKTSTYPINCFAEVLGQVPSPLTHNKQKGTAILIQIPYIGNYNNSNAVI